MRGETPSKNLSADTELDPGTCLVFAEKRVAKAVIGAE